VEVQTITLMFHVLDFFAAHGYHVSMLGAEHASRSRGHLIASPRSSLRGAVSRWLVRPRLTARE
jgi:hypothetical protein